jgi:8-oxo-dGTP pyrophosphatase MutT (NUDIX family)
VEPLFEQLRQELEKRPGKMLEQPQPGLRESAVLAPLFIRDAQPYLVFTKRRAALRNHGGQISFPGGARDPDDSTPLHTALRETREELGIPPETIEVLGMLDEVPTITNFRILPFVGAIPTDFAYLPSPDEIEKVIEVPLVHLFNPSVHRVERRWVMESEREIYFYDYGPNVIWGVTARILRGLLQLIGGLPAFQRFRS